MAASVKWPLPSLRNASHGSVGEYVEEIVRGAEDEVDVAVVVEVARVGDAPAAAPFPVARGQEPRGLGRVDEDAIPGVARVRAAHEHEPDLLAGEHARGRRPTRGARCGRHQVGEAVSVEVRRDDGARDRLEGRRRAETDLGRDFGKPREARRPGCRCLADAGRERGSRPRVRRRPLAISGRRLTVARQRRVRDARRRRPVLQPDPRATAPAKRRAVHPVTYRIAGEH